jgi:hypothetical protein
MSSLEKEADKAMSYHAACDRLADTMRRHISAFCAYRYPERKRFVAVKRANIAQQQIVINSGKKRGRPKKRTLPVVRHEGGELGCEVPVRQAPFNMAQGRRDGPFDFAHDGPFDLAHDGPFDFAQGRLVPGREGGMNGLNIGGIVSGEKEAGVSAGAARGGKEEALHLPAKAVGEVDGASDEAREVEG